MYVINESTTGLLMRICLLSRFREIYDSLMRLVFSYFYDSNCVARLLLLRHFPPWLMRTETMRTLHGGGLGLLSAVAQTATRAQ